MARLKKAQILVVSFTLILTICFPPVIKTVEAAPTLENSVYYVEVDELKGRSSVGQLLIGVIGGLITDVWFTFFDTQLKNMTLKKLVHTDNGPMVVTMRSERLNELIEAGTLNIYARELSFDFWRTIADLPNLITPGTVYDVKANIIELESSRIQINDLVVDISFDPNEIQQLQQMQRSLQQVDPKENLEETLLMLDELEGGKLSKQKEAFEALVKDLPKQEEKAAQIGQLLDDAEQQKSDIHNNITELDDALTQEPNEDEIDAQLKNVIEQFENHIKTLDQIGVSIDEIEQTLTAYVEIVNLRAQYLQELGLVDWSESYKKLAEVKGQLHQIVNVVEKHVNRYNKLNEQKDGFEEKLSQLKEQIATLDASTPKEVPKVAEEPQNEQTEMKKQLNGKLEEFQEKEEPTLLETILEENEIPENIDIEQLKEEMDAFLTEKAKEIERLKDEKEQQEAIVKVLKETLSQYAGVLVGYYEKLQAEKEELEKHGDENREQIADLEVKITIIGNLVARIEELDEELSLIFE